MAKIPVDTDQFELMRNMAREINISVEQVSYFVIELGFATMLASRKLNKDGETKLPELVKTLNESISAEPILVKMAEIVDASWKKG